MPTYKSVEKQIRRAQRALGVILRIQGPSGRLLYTPHRAAKTLGIPTAQVHRMVRTGRMEGRLFLDDSLRIPNEALLEFATSELSEAMRAVAKSIANINAARVRAEKKWMARLSPQDNWRLRVSLSQSRRRLEQAKKHP